MTLGISDRGRFLPLPVMAVNMGTHPFSLSMLVHLRSDQKIHTGHCVPEGRTFNCRRKAVFSAVRGLSAGDGAACGRWTDFLAVVPFPVVGPGDAL